MDTSFAVTFLLLLINVLKLFRNPKRGIYKKKESLFSWTIWHWNIGPPLVGHLEYDGCGGWTYFATSIPALFAVKDYIFTWLPVLKSSITSLNDTSDLDLLLSIDHWAPIVFFCGSTFLYLDLIYYFEYF